MREPSDPDSNSSHFHSVCTREPGWHRIKVSSLDSPNFTGEPVPDHMADTLVNQAWVEDKRLRWGETDSHVSPRASSMKRSRSGTWR